MNALSLKLEDPPPPPAKKQNKKSKLNLTLDWLLHKQLFYDAKCQETKTDV